MTTATMSYASEPCGYVHLYFYGSGATSLEEGWDDIKYDKFHKHKALIEDYKSKIKNRETIISNLRSELKASKKWYRPWYTKTEQELRDKINQEIKQNEELEYKIYVLDNDMFYESYELRTKATKYLKDLGFVVTNSSYGGRYGSILTEVWTRY